VKTTAIFFILIVAVLVVAPFALSSYFVGFILKAMIYALFAMSYNVVFGYLGLPSLGHAAFFGTAAYVAAIVGRIGVSSITLQIAAGLGAALLAALIFAAISLRARGVYHLVITMALAQILFGVAFGWRDVTGGDDGIAGIHRPTFGLDGFAGDVAFYYFAVGVCAFGGFAYVLLAHSPLGRIFVGIRENEQRMRVLGYNIILYQIAGIVLASLGAGLSGILLAYQTGYVGVNSLSVGLSAEALLMVILGGAGTTAGPFVGATIVTALQAATSNLTEHWPLVLGLIYVVVVLWAPKGLVGWFNDRRTRSTP
jgi:branched-chain amino acid transport system permease protein